MPSDTKRTPTGVWLVYLIAILVGGIAVGSTLPHLSATVDGRLYHDADTLSGLGNDMFGGLIPLFWDAYSILLGVAIGALVVTSFRDRRGWSGPLWLGTSILFYLTMPSERPQGDIIPTLDINFLPFQVFYVVPTWFCEGVAIVGAVLSLAWLTWGLMRRLL